MSGGVTQSRTPTMAVALLVVAPAKERETRDSSLSGNKHRHDDGKCRTDVGAGCSGSSCSSSSGV